MRLSKRFTFDAAHMLSRYNGKCANLHGHTYHVEVDIVGHTDGDILVDFNDIKNFFDEYDHAIIFAGDDVRCEAEEELLDWAKTYDYRYTKMPKNQRPTAENMARFMADKLYIATKKDGVTAVSIRLWETPSSYAEATSNIAD